MLVYAAMAVLQVDKNATAAAAGMYRTFVSDDDEEMRTKMIHQHGTDTFDRTLFARKAEGGGPGVSAARGFQPEEVSQDDVNAIASITLSQAGEHMATMLLELRCVHPLRRTDGASRPTSGSRARAGGGYDG